MSSIHVSDIDRARIERLVRALGEAGAIQKLGLARNTLIRALSGLPVREGTVLLLQAKLANVDAGK